MLEKPMAMQLASQRQDQVMIKLGLALFLFGLLLPAQWRTLFGMVGEPVAWLAEVLPSIRKASAISPIGELVRGFFGTGFLLLPVFYVIFMWRDPIGMHFKYALEQGTSKFKRLSFIYLLGMPVMVFLLYLILFWPGEMRLGITPTRGQMIFSVMVSYRLTLAFFGSLVILGALGFLYIMTIYLIGPFFYFIERVNHRVN
jgi:hypothetical protein